MLGDNGYPIALYEDLPYSGDIPADQIERYITNLKKEKKIKLRPVTINIEQVFKQKIQRINMYKSQISGSIIKRIMKHAKNINNGIPTERIWVNDKVFDIIKSSDGFVLA